MMPPLPASPSLFRAYKKIELEDLKFPLVCGEGKKVKCEVEVGEGRRQRPVLREGLGKAQRWLTVQQLPTSFPSGPGDGHHRGDPRLGRPQPEGLQFHPAHQALPLLLPGGEPWPHG